MQGYISRQDSRSLLTISRFAQLLIALYIVVWLGVSVLGAWSLSIVMTQPYNQMWFVVLGLRAMVAALGMLVFAVTLVLFLVWFHKALSNLHDAGLSGLEARPGWAVGSFFVPVANLIVPYRAMRELWNRSHGEDEWQAKAAVGDVASWWTCYLAGTFVLFFVIAITSFNALTFFEITTPAGVNEALGLAGALLWCLSAFFLFRIIGTVTRAQQSLADERLAFA